MKLLEGEQLNHCNTGNRKARFAVFVPRVSFYGLGIIFQGAKIWCREKRKLPIY